MDNSEKSKWETKMDTSKPKMRMLNAETMDKDSLTVILANLADAIPFCGLKPDEQIKNQPFLCGMIYGLGISLDAPYFPEAITDPKYNQAVMKLIERAIYSHPKLFRGMMPTGITKEGKTVNFEEVTKQ